MIDEVRKEIERVWPAAQEHWSRFLLLSAPKDLEDGDNVAMIDLARRQVFLNEKVIAEKGLVGSVEALLAHEVGHHVRYPGTLAVDARLRLLERALIPFEGYSVVNPFTDLMINHRLGESLSEQLCAVYRSFSFHEDERWKRDPAFLFYLAIYEELWQRPTGDLIGAQAEEGFAAMFPGYRAEVRVLAQDIFHLGSNLYAQFLYFLSVMLRYMKVPDGQDPTVTRRHDCGRGDPTPDDWAAALRPSAAEEEAISRARERGWINEHEAAALDRMLEQRVAGLPGVQRGEADGVPEIMAAYYRQEAERFLFRPPRQRMLGEAIVPTTLDEWRPGDEVASIDWLATFAERGAELGAAAPMRRDRVAEYEGHDVSLWQPRMEIYLDVSGSMPDPRRAMNAMTLAAQILCASTIRAGGWVRAILYSTASVPYWEWCRSEVEMSRFLMHYVGGGTVFPFAQLERSVAECGREQPIRVVISDRDFDSNVASQKAHRQIVARAIAASPSFVLLLHASEQSKAYRSMGATAIDVVALGDFPKMARELALALFPDGADVEVG